MAGMVMLIGPEGQELEVEPLRRGGRVRIAFGQPGLRASVWNIIAQPKGEVYVMERRTGSQLKVSLHKSGDWRYQWITENLHNSLLAQKVIESRGSRIVDQWDRPPAGAGNLTVGYTILTTEDDLSPITDMDLKPEDVIWLPAPGAGQVGIITVAFVRPHEVIRLRGFLPITAFAMDTGEAVIVLAACREMRDAERSQVASIRKKIAMGLPAALPAHLKENAASYRALFHDANDQGMRFAYDLAAASSLTLEGDATHSHD